MNKAKALDKLAERLDKDPKAWPIHPALRVYMVDCKSCGTRHWPTKMAAQAHARRCEKR